MSQTSRAGPLRDLVLNSGAHHDGSGLYVSDPYPSPGEVVTLRLRVGAELAATAVFVRTTVDGDQRFVGCVRGGEGADVDWWSASVAMRNTCLGYRFLIATPCGARTLNASGLHAREVTDGHDFRLTLDPAPARWASDAVFYEIFLDRFARSDAADLAALPLPGWAVGTPWTQPVAHDTRNGVLQLYRGDLRGVVDHLDHLQDLGVTAIYLTPFFPGSSNHRYDASTFEHVDPLLGGDAALKDLTAAAHDRNLRVLGDLTLNHTGSTHQWFRAASADESCTEAGYYLFSRYPDRYEAFGDEPSMPKLDHRSPDLRRHLFDGKDSVAFRYLFDFGLDGWRIDVAQSAGHSGLCDRSRATARATMATARAARPDAYVVAEHQFDASTALAGDTWHGAMAYAAFTRPVWSWLAENDIDRYWGVPAGHAPYTGAEMAQVMDEFNATIPWRSRVHSLNLLDSHDTPRLLSIAGRDRYAVAVGVLLTMPGIPMVFAGDEIGTHGVDLEDGRQPFRWDKGSWDHELLAWHRTLIQLRRTHPALVSGGFRWLHTGDDVIVFERAHAEQTLIVQAARRAHEPLACTVHATDLLAGHDLAPGDTLPESGPSLGVWRVQPTPADRG